MIHDSKSIPACSGICNQDVGFEIHLLSSSSTLNTAESRHCWFHNERESWWSWMEFKLWCIQHSFTVSIMRSGGNGTETKTRQRQWCFCQHHDENGGGALWLWEGTKSTAPRKRCLCHAMFLGERSSHDVSRWPKEELYFQSPGSTTVAFSISQPILDGSKSLHRHQKTWERIRKTQL